VGVGTVYRHFPGKEHVVATVFDEEVDRVVGLAERALQHPQPWRVSPSSISTSQAS